MKSRDYNKLLSLSNKTTNYANMFNFEFTDEELDNINAVDFVKMLN